MPESPREVFERAAATHDPELEGLDGRTLRFTVEGQGSWLLTIKDGGIDVAESTAPADTVVSTSEPDFYALTNGELNLVTAWMRGQIQVEGDPWIAQKLHSVIRARSYDRSQRLSA
jgi:putative sterol carrier protein